MMCVQILYRVQVVFPSPDIVQHSSPNAAFTLAAGVYEYPFEFKVRATKEITPRRLADEYAVPVQ